MTEKPTADTTKPADGTPAPADDLDALLNEFTAAPEPPAPPAKPAAVVKPTAPQELEARLRRLETQDRAKQYEQAVSETVSRVREHQPGLTAIPDKLLKARLDVAVDDDPRIGQAFQNRHKNPQAWGKILKGVAEEIAKELDAIPNPQDVNDRASALHMSGSRAASPSKSADKPDNAALSKMTDAEFFASLPR